MPEHSTDDVKVPGVRASVVVRIVRVVKQFQFLLKVMSQIHGGRPEDGTCRDTARPYS